jgi:glycosyltransferase involved in cell wall biosynthesis
MGLAIVTETYPPELNGVARTLARLVEGLATRGHRITVLRPRVPGMEAGDYPGVEQHGLASAPIPFYPSLRMGLPCSRSLEALWRGDPPDLVHIATEGPLGWSALLAARACGLPVSTEFRTNFHAYTRHYGLGWLNGAVLGYLRRFHNAADLTMVPSEPLRRELEGFGFEGLCVVGRGVDTTRFDPAWRDRGLRRDWGARDCDPVLLYVGRLASEKNLDILFAAHEATAARQAAKGTETRLVVTGDGPLAARLRRRHPRAIFTGPLRGDDLSRHYASADLFVFPSLTETWGNVTVEALASGLPVVAWDHAAAGQLVRPGHNGWLAAPGDERAFVDGVQRIAEAAAERERLRAAARASATDQGWDGVVQDAERELLRLATGSHRRSLSRVCRSAVATP